MEDAVPISDASRFPYNFGSWERQPQDVGGARGKGLPVGCELLPGDVLQAGQNWLTVPNPFFEKGAIQNAARNTRPISRPTAHPPMMSEAK